MTTMKRISVIGQGFVGLTLTVALAYRGFKVIGIDKQPKIIEDISHGRPAFYEEGLQPMLKTVLDNGSFTVTQDLRDAVLKSDITFICVGTPTKRNGSIDLDYIKQASEKLAPALAAKKHYHTIVVKSTVTPGTTENLVGKTIESRGKIHRDKDFGLAMNPEFLREGTALADTLNPHLVVIGASDTKCQQDLSDLYLDFYADKTPKIMKTNIITAELIKYSNNAFLATKISFINTIANICEKIPGADVDIIAAAIGEDPRIGKEFLKAGPGYGGSCFPKDLAALISFYKDAGVDQHLFTAVRKTNDDRPLIVLHHIESALGGNIANKKIAILGLSFKKNTDDTRESVSLKLINHLLVLQAKVSVHDPMAIENTQRLFGDRLQYCTSVEDCVQNADCCVIMTDWDEYKKLSSKMLCEKMRKPRVIDTRRMLSREEVVGLEYHATGVGHNNGLTYRKVNSVKFKYLEL